MGKNLVFKANFSQDGQKNCIVDKVIKFSDYLYEQLSTHPLNETWEIRKNRCLLRENKDGCHCILFVNNDTGDGLLVGAENTDSPVFSQHISYAADILLAQDLTRTEKSLHEFLHKRINDYINNKEGGMELPFGEFDDDPEYFIMHLRIFDEIASQNHAVETTEFDSGRIIIEKKDLVTTKLYCPLEIQMCEDDSCDLEVVSSYCLSGYEYEINGRIEKEFEESQNEKEKKRGLIAYTDSERLDASVYSAFPSVEEHGGKLYGVLTVKSFGELSENDLADLTDEMTGQFSDGWGEGFEQRSFDFDDGEYYISFWNCGNDYYLKPESEVFPQPDMTIKM